MRIIVVSLMFFLTIQVVHSKDCLIVNSYHEGYEWSDNVQNAIEVGLKGICDIRVLYMDTKRKKSKEQIQSISKKIKEDIERSKPDVVITTDDNAVKYILKPYFKNSNIPFVFCGVNWSAKKYGLPYKNSSGMVEVSPIIELLKEIKRIKKNLKRAAFLGPDVPSDHKNYKKYKELYKKQGIEVKQFVYQNNMKSWMDNYTKAQKYDFVILANNVGVKDWDDSKAIQMLKEKTKTLTVTSKGWMKRFTMISMVKSAKEQGDWSAELAQEVLGGKKISEFPIVSNIRFDYYVNIPILDRAGFRLPIRSYQRAVKIRD